MMPSRFLVVVFAVASLVGCPSKNSDSASGVSDDDGDSKSKKRRSKAREGDSDAAAMKPPEARCSPAHVLTDDERYQLMQELEDGKAPCPEWSAAEARVDGQGLSLNGEKLEHEHPSGRMSKIAPLFEKLKVNRENWKSFHPASAFPGTLTIVAAKGVGSDVGLSVLTTAAYAGYPNLTVKSEGTTVTFGWNVPAPPDAASDGELFVETLGAEGFQAGVFSFGSLDAESKTVPVSHLMTPRDGKALELWLAERCEGDVASRPASCGRLRLRVTNGPFADSLKHIGTLVALPPFASAKPNVSASLACPGSLEVANGDKCPLEARSEETSATTGKLPPEVIQRIVRQNFGGMRKCYEDGLKTNPKLQGRVVVRFVIGRDGRTGSVSGSGDIPDAAVITCVTRVFSGLSFPQPEGGIVTVSYPIVFTPS